MKGTARMRAVCGNWSVRAATAVAVLLLVCDSAQAFYWYNWPGSRLRVDEPIIPTPIIDVPGNPPPPGTGPRPVPPIGPPVPVDNPPGPNPTPEPATGLLGLLGIGVLVVRSWRR